MIKKINIKNLESAERVLSVQFPSYRIEAALLDNYEIPPLKDTVASLHNCDETFFGYFIDEELCGVISVKLEEDIVDIHRLFVHPNHLRKGIAKKLLYFLQEEFHDAKKMIVTTGSKNSPAIEFYQKNGFTMLIELTVEENLSLTLFEKNMN
ncbi:GNAT family N-acetyltransferase [Rummeliibacillus sp. TYF005]|uniref:GNAT family N-acetyltransferase n=1 Tax=Rummeliibacillus sp. TYF005 TaxID=2058214 RepID=UPI000F530D86|nr:GNAT family N-acetyltransferase [Rummeliibacillus sp. TYF005]RPJ96397.1 GNAT family N-acetyltransferase [Rummeliibacillus sp. TYF005]